MAGEYGPTWSTPRRRVWTKHDAIVPVAKAWGLSQGFRGLRGGVILTSGDAEICRGWREFYARYRVSILDSLAREYTASPSWDRLLSAAIRGRRPVILRTEYELPAWFLARELETYVRRGGEMIWQAAEEDDL